MKKQKKLLLVIITVGLVTSTFATKILYLEAKAKLAQVLLTQAWQKTKEHQTTTKPWSWADIYPVGALIIPKLNIQQIILNGHQGEALAFGPGQLKKESAIALAGHRDTHFAFLENLNIGDSILIENKNGEHTTYEIHNIFIQDSRKSPNLTLNPNTLSLITCYPFNSPSANGSLRFIVEAKKTSANTNLFATL